jgi:outer membrane cobalamin receptor
VDPLPFDVNPTFLVMLAACLSVTLGGMRAVSAADTPGTHEDGRVEPREDEVIVRSTAIKPPGTTARIPKREMLERGAVNIGEVLQTELGAEVQNGPKDGATLQLGGFDEKSTQVTIEGIPILESYSGFIDLSLFPVGLFSSIELERGIVSVTAGPNTQGGVLTLRLGAGCSRPRFEVFALAGKPYQGRPMDWRGATSGCISTGRWTFLGAADWLISDGYVVSGDLVQTRQNAAFHEDGGQRDGSGQQKRAFTAISRYELTPAFTVTGLFAFMQAPRSIPVHTRAGFKRYWTMTFYDSFILGLTARWQPRTSGVSRGAQAVVFWHHHKDQIDDWEDLTYTRLSTNPAAFFQSSAYVNDSFGGFGDVGLAFMKRQKLTLGLRYQLQVHTSREKPVPATGSTPEWGATNEMVNHLATLSAENLFRVGDWRLVQGVAGSVMQLVSRQIRETEYPVNESPMPGVEARLLAERRVGPDWTWSVGVGHKIRYPVFKELFSNRVGGNPGLRPEKALMAEAGFDSRRLFHPSLKTSSRLFYSHVEGLIDRWGDAYENLGDAVLAGIESELNWQTSPRARTFVRHRYLWAHDLENDRKLVNRAPHRLTAGLRLRLPAGFSGGLEVDFRDRKRVEYYDLDDGQYHIDDSAGRTLIHARIRYDRTLGAGPEGWVMLSGRNLLDSHYEDGSFEPRPGREVWLTLGLAL